MEPSHQGQISQQGLAFSLTQGIGQFLQSRIAVLQCFVTFHGNAPFCEQTRTLKNHGLHATGLLSGTERS